MKETILTGIRANSELHLGHYLGVILPVVRLAKKHAQTLNLNLFVPDLHSIISSIEGDFWTNIAASVNNYRAAGLELSENVHFYRQSRVPAHAELCWALNCTATMGELLRMTQYKDKSKGGDTSTNVGIFDYPVLMAADILLYSARYVPVGEDQFQHIELARNLAMRFNSKFGEVFVPPVETRKQVEFMGLTHGIRIRDLTNPEKKMSKSTPGENSKIMLSDSPERARKKIMSATTDSFGEIHFDWQTRPGISNLLQILAILKDRPLNEVLAEWEGQTSYGNLKKTVAEAVEAFLVDFQAKKQQFTAEEVFELFPNGERYANEVAGAKLAEVYRALGL